ncbi:transcriptional regulator [Ktedonobacter sp. SOSP1-52]|uniref:Rrf2 family transcriptional regulator n=1 Tax=Ktedonobacter sp. SOSP1-52 TaxID=2778366 RepID=UPI0019161C84|nr:Rrf2 family transcriptional regulator [Ktedonobacter sp. SOSP1-52]GHO70246.1 transcriptional regulator [Ktedonobacter sp. SOSP1-52]
MSGNSRLTLAVHTLTWMARRMANYGDQYDFSTSREIAESVNTNPVTLRELLGMMEEQGLVTVQRGSNAGWKLARKPEEITLLEVYQVVKPHTMFTLHHTPPNPKCPIGCGIGPALQGVYANVQEAMEEELARTTIADVLRDTLASTAAIHARQNE